MIDDAVPAAAPEAAPRHVPTLVIDVNGLFREGLKQLLDDSQFRIEFEFASLKEALAHVGQDCRPELILSEFDGSNDSVGQFNGLRAACPDSKLVVLTNKLVPRSLARSLEAGADGYLLKDISVEALTQSLSLVMVGEKVFPTQLAGFLIQGKARPERPIFRPGVRPNGLSDREEAILRCLVYGYPNKIIADQLQMTEASVKVHLKVVLRKIRAANRTQAAIWAINNGFHAEHGSGDGA
jgi:two-component system nitrate/nitrite response regulator NarL